MRWTGSLYYATEENETEHHFMANFDVEAKLRRDAMKQIMDLHWDDRLDAGGCYPVFKWGRTGEINVSASTALIISDRLGTILQCSGSSPPSTQLLQNALREVESEFGIGSVVLALQQVTSLLRKANQDVFALAEAVASINPFR